MKWFRSGEERGDCDGKVGSAQQMGVCICYYYKAVDDGQGTITPEGICTGIVIIVEGGAWGRSTLRVSWLYRATIMRPPSPPTVFTLCLLYNITLPRPLRHIHNHHLGMWAGNVMLSSIDYFIHSYASP